MILEFLQSILDIILTYVKIMFFLLVGKNDISHKYNIDDNKWGICFLFFAKKLPATQTLIKESLMHFNKLVNLIELNLIMLCHDVCENYNSFDLISLAFCYGNFLYLVVFFANIPPKHDLSIQNTPKWSLCSFMI